MLQGHLNYYAVSGNHPSAARRRISPGSASSGLWIASSRQSRCYTRCLFTASTPEPEGGARCVSSARRDLCGGRGVILVPTATEVWGVRPRSVGHPQAATGGDPSRYVGIVNELRP